MWSGRNLSGNEATRIWRCLKRCTSRLTPFLCQPFVNGKAPDSRHPEPWHCCSAHPAQWSCYPKWYQCLSSSPTALGSPVGCGWHGEEGAIMTPSLMIHHYIPTLTLIDDSNLSVFILKDWQIDFHVTSRLPVALGMMLMPWTSRCVGSWWYWWRGWHWASLTLKPMIWWRWRQWWWGGP